MGYNEISVSLKPPHGEKKVLKIYKAFKTLESKTLLVTDTSNRKVGI